MLPVTLASKAMSRRVSGCLKDTWANKATPAQDALAKDFGSVSEIGRGHPEGYTHDFDSMASQPSP